VCAPARRPAVSQHVYCRHEAHVLPCARVRILDSIAAARSACRNRNALESRLCRASFLPPFVRGPYLGVLAAGGGHITVSAAEQAAAPDRGPIRWPGAEAPRARGLRPLRSRHVKARGQVNGNGVRRTIAEGESEKPATAAPCSQETAVGRRHSRRTLKREAHFTPRRFERSAVCREAHGAQKFRSQAFDVFARGWRGRTARSVSRGKLAARSAAVGRTGHANSRIRLVQRWRPHSARAFVGLKPPNKPLHLTAARYAGPALKRLARADFVRCALGARRLADR